ncbi:hypothetical protein [Marisediminicola sp. LYQ85]|uniref:hypothetical protein n=1 Tax=Marisediminicola sp. LYQ85 TaxID=3391062 RepID=UPI003982E1AE
MSDATTVLSGQRRLRDIVGFVVLYLVQLCFSFYGFAVITDFVLTRSYDCSSYGGEWGCLNTYWGMIIPPLAGIVIAVVVPVWGVVRIRDREGAYWLPLAAIAVLTVIFAGCYGYVVYALADPASRFSF